MDAYDLIKSGFANTVQDCAEIYWIVENAGGMNDKDLQQLRDRLLLTLCLLASGFGMVLIYSATRYMNTRRGCAAC